jgi:hypothetical protein
VAVGPWKSSDLHPLHSQGESILNLCRHGQDILFGKDGRRLDTLCQVQDLRLHLLKVSTDVQLTVLVGEICSSEYCNSQEGVSD